MVTENLFLNPALYWGLVKSVSVLFTLAFMARQVRAYAWRRFNRRATQALRRVVAGVLYGAIAAIGMSNSFEFFPGVVIDARIPLVAVAGLIGGWTSAICAALIAGLVRIHLGGTGMLVGIAFIAVAVPLGAGLHTNFQTRTEMWTIKRFIYFGSMLAAITSLGGMLIPGHFSDGAFNFYTLPAFVIFNAATLTVGLYEASELLRERQKLKLLENSELLKVCEEVGQIGSWSFNTLTSEFSCSESFGRIFGVVPEALRTGTKSTFAHLVHPDDRELVTRHWLATMAGSPKEGPFEYRVVRSDGSVRQIWGANVWFEDASGERLMFGIAQDVTEFKEAQTQLLRSAKLASIGQLAAGVAHEINNPLFILQEQSRRISHLLCHKGNACRETERSLTHQMESIKRIERIVKGLSTYARGKDMNSVAFDAQEVLTTTLDLFMDLVPKANFELVRALTALPVPVRGDPNRLEQVLINLLVNALHATEGNPARRIRVVSAVHESEAYISVEDNGVGIASENIDRIFDSFFTTKEPGKGTGLGLSISLNYVRTMGGRIDVRSKPGEGACFELVLPLELTAEEQLV